MASLTVIILTHNEERHIARAIECALRIAEKIYVVDSFSDDRTVEIATEMNASVIQHAFVSHAKQFQWAIDAIQIETEWVMRLDADEIIELDLISTIEGRLLKLPADVTGVSLNRKHVFMGRWIRHGGRYPLFLLRIWRRGYGKIEDLWMDEHIFVTSGRIVTFDGGFVDHNLNDLTFFINKHNDYATREAIEVLNKRLRLRLNNIPDDLIVSTIQARVKRVIKEKIYNRIPFQVSAFIYFIFRYIIQLGFLDGTEGLIYHGLQGFWYRFLVGAKVLELERAVNNLIEPAHIKNELSRRTGLKIE